MLSLRFLRLTGPTGRRVLRFDSANGQSIKRKALLNSRCPLRGHRVYEGKIDNVAPLLLYAGPTSTDLHILCRMCTG